MEALRIGLKVGTVKRAPQSTIPMRNRGYAFASRQHCPDARFLCILGTCLYPVEEKPCSVATC
jgi:hypothetical protein